MSIVILVSAFSMGLLGGAHCAGMCSGIATALSVPRASTKGPAILQMLPLVSAYNFGRITSYAIAGGLVGGIGSLGWALAKPDTALLISRYIAFAFMAALALYLLGWWRGLTYLELVGARLWKYIEPAGRRFIPARHPLQALVLGLVWGWLPCGMVYAALGWALVSGGVVQGALIMLAFGIGTLPLLMALGLSGHWLISWTRLPRVRQAAGMLILIAAVVLLIGNPTSGHLHQHHGTVQSVQKVH